MSSKVRFYLNGSPIVLDCNTVDPDGTLLDFVRSQGLTGTKLGCGEGGCGSCTVVLQSRDQVTGELQHRAVNACLAPIISVDGKHVITIEGLGNSEHPHPLQERMWKMSGSQCGFCSPGIIMSIYALLRTAVSNGSLTVQDVELEGALHGNLCRCTGYKTILDAAKSFVGDYTDRVKNRQLSGIMEDFVVPFNYAAANLQPGEVSSCCGPVKSTTPTGCGRADCCQLPNAAPFTSLSSTFPRFELRPYRPGTELIFPPGLAQHEFVSLEFGSPHRRWYRPATLDELIELKSLHPQAKIVGGSTEIQIEVKQKAAHYPVSIFIGDSIPELRILSPPTSTSLKFEFGANLPLFDLDAFCISTAASLAPELRGPLDAISHQLRYFAGRQVKNVASVGGNLATASPISDLNPVWISLEASVIARSKSAGEFSIPVAEFFVSYRKTKLPADAVLLRISVPLNSSSDREVVRSYKQAKRKDDDIAIVTCCFAVKVNTEGIITFCRLTFGGMGALTVSARKTEAFLLGKSISTASLEAGLDVLGSEMALNFNVPGGMASYRNVLCLTFLYKFFYAVSDALDIPLGATRVELDDIVADEIHRPPSSGKRDNSDPYAKEVVGKQIPHLNGLKHCTGEAIYIDDMPRIGNEAVGALVLSTKANAKILSVDATAALAVEGVISYVDHTDLPDPKANYWGAVIRDEVFFAVDYSPAYGVPIGLIVATTKLIAQRAARLVKVEYEELPTPLVLTIEQGIQHNSFHEFYDRRIIKGAPIDEALASADLVLEGTTRLGGQEHFYLETMAALAIPREGGQMELWASTQALTDAQHWASQVTGVSRSRIVAKCSKLGGGFGGKETRSSHLSTIVALAAKKCRRAVRVHLDRTEDIQTSGQRHPTLCNWKVGVTAKGKLVALKADFFINGGHSLDISGGVADRGIAHIENCYAIPNVAVRGRIIKSHTVSNTAFRGFGGPQGMLVAEHYIEAIAHKLGLDIDEVRRINLYAEGEETHYHQPVVDWHVPRLLKELRVTSDYDRRRRDVDQFNQEHRWRKRGLVMVPTKFGLAFGVKSMNQGAALVHIYLDGSVLVAHGGTEMGQGLYSKCCQIAAQELGVSINEVFTSETATNTVPNALPTAASAGSDLQGHAVHLACVILNERLAPFREKLGSDASMSALANAAYQERISLSATGHYAPQELGYEWGNQNKSANLFMYYTQGVAVSEVELDCLTGDHSVIRVDILMDVGHSLNPAIDFGQIEGAFVQGMSWCTLEESLWLQNGAIATQGPGSYKIAGFSDIPQVFNVSLLKDAEWPNLRSIKGSKGIGEPPLFLGTSVALALRDALKSARSDSGIVELQEFRMPMSSERLRLACGDTLVVKGRVEAKEGEKEFFVHI